MNIKYYKLLLFLLVLTIPFASFAEQYQFGTDNIDRNIESTYEYFNAKPFQFDLDTSTNRLFEAIPKTRKNKDVALIPPNGVFNGEVDTNPINNLYFIEARNTYKTFNVPSNIIPVIDSRNNDEIKIKQNESLNPNSDILIKNEKFNKSIDFVNIVANPDKDGVIGRFQLPALNFDYKIYNDVSYKTMNKGLGHIPGTPVFEGNVGLAGHNRGTINAIGNIRKAKVGDEIVYTLGEITRKYIISDFIIVNVEDVYVLDNTKHNQLTIVTCIDNKPNIRLIVIALEKGE